MMNQVIEQTNELPDSIKQALEAWHAGDPDTVPEVTVRSAYRDLSCKSSGPECYRRVLYPGSTHVEWPDAPRLPAPGVLAASRRCTEYMQVPVGTLVVDFEREVYKGQRGKCKVMIGLVAQNVAGKGRIEWLTHRTLRKTPHYEVTLPDGAKVLVPRRV